MVANDNQRVSDRQLLLGWAVAVCVVLAILGWSIVTKGTWFDEQWSKWMSSRELPIGEAARQRWFRDVHPPFFYLFNWSASAIVGEAVVTHRWLNLVWLAALGAVGVWIAAISPARRPALVVGALLLLSNTDFNKFGEYRSYAIVLCATAALMLLFQEMLSRPRDLSFDDDRGLALGIAVTILLALNLHYITTLICGLTIGVFALDQARSGRWRWAALLVGVAAVAIVPLLAALLAERPYMQDALPDFWVRSSSLQALATLGAKLVLATGVNIAVLIALVQVLASRFGLAGAAPPLAAEQRDWHFVVLAGLAFLVSCAALFGINIFKPVVIPRYVNGLSPILVAMFAALTAERIVSRRWLFAVFVVNAVVIAGYLAWSVQKKPAWDEAARLVQAEIRACPDTRVYSVWRFYGLPKPNLPPLPNELEFIVWAMDDLARDYGIPLRFVEPPPAGTLLPRGAGACPVVVWIENYALDGPRTAQKIGLIANAGEAARLRTVHTRTGTVLVLSPP